MSSKPRVTNNQTPTGNVIRDSALGLAPETLTPYVHLNKEIWNGPLNAAEIEMARIRNARKVNCVFCRNVRYDIAKDAGLNESKVEMIEDGYDESDLTQREKLILAYTDQYLNDPGGLTDELRTELSDTFSAEELVHLSMAIAHFNGFSRCAVSLGGMPDQMPVMEISIPD